MEATAVEGAWNSDARRGRGEPAVIAALIGILVLFFVAFYPSITWVAGEWSSSSGALSHGYLVAVISLVLFLKALPEAARREIRPAWWLLPGVLGLSGAWLLGYVATVVAVQTVVLPAILLLAMASVIGIGAARPLAFPVLYIYFALPAWEHLQFIFQSITVSAVTVLLWIADVPALITGNFVEIPRGIFEIAGGCSGLSFVVAGLSLAVLYTYLYFSRVSQGFVLTAVTLLVAMAGNWIRVFGIILVGYHSGMDHPLVADHLTLGWVMFGILMIPVFFLARRIENWNGAREQRAEKSHTHGSAQSRLNWVALVAGVVAMLAGPAWSQIALISNADSLPGELQFPAATGAWAGPVESHWGWRPKFAGADLERTVEYRLDEDLILVHANLYRSQAQDRELVYFSNDVRGNWQMPRRQEVSLADVETADGRPFAQAVASSYLGTWLIWYGYRHGERWDADASGAKLSQALETLAGRADAGLVAFAAPCGSDDCAQAHAVLARFYADIGYGMGKSLIGETE